MWKLNVRGEAILVELAHVYSMSGGMKYMMIYFEKPSTDPVRCGSLSLNDGKDSLSLSLFHFNTWRSFINYERTSCCHLRPQFVFWAARAEKLLMKIYTGSQNN